MSTLIPCMISFIAGYLACALIQKISAKKEIEKILKEQEDDARGRLPRVFLIDREEHLERLMPLIHNPDMETPLGLYTLWKKIEELIPEVKGGRWSLARKGATGPIMVVERGPGIRDFERIPPEEMERYARQVPGEEEETL
jgi:hypothetical protein